MMNFALTDAQKEIQLRAREFAQKEVAPACWSGTGAKCSLWTC